MKFQHGGCRNTYSETKGSGGGDEQNKLNKVKTKRVYVCKKIYDSLRLLIPCDFKVPAKSIKKDFLAFLI